MSASVRARTRSPRQRTGQPLRHRDRPCRVQCSSAHIGERFPDIELPGQSTVGDLTHQIECKFPGLKVFALLAAGGCELRDPHQRLTHSGLKPRITQDAVTIAVQLVTQLPRPIDLLLEHAAAGKLVWRRELEPCDSDATARSGASRMQAPHGSGTYWTIRCFNCLTADFIGVIRLRPSATVADLTTQILLNYGVTEPIGLLHKESKLDDKRQQLRQAGLSDGSIVNVLREQWPREVTTSNIEPFGIRFLPKEYQRQWVVRVWGKQWPCNEGVIVCGVHYHISHLRIFASPRFLASPHHTTQTNEKRQHLSEKLAACIPLLKELPVDDGEDDYQYLATILGVSPDGEMLLAWLHRTPNNVLVNVVGWMRMCPQTYRWEAAYVADESEHFRPTSAVFGLERLFIGGIRTSPTSGAREYVIKELERGSGALSRSVSLPGLPLGYVGRHWIDARLLGLDGAESTLWLSTSEGVVTVSTDNLAYWQVASWAKTITEASQHHQLDPQDIAVESVILDPVSMDIYVLLILERNLHPKLHATCSLHRLQASCFQADDERIRYTYLYRKSHLCDVLFHDERSIMRCTLDGCYDSREDRILFLDTHGHIMELRLRDIRKHKDDPSRALCELHKPRPSPDPSAVGGGSHTILTAEYSAASSSS